MEGLPDLQIDVPQQESLKETDTNFSNEFNEALVRSEAEFAIINLCDYFMVRRENEYIDLASEESINSLYNAVKKLQNAHEKEVIPLDKLKGHFEEILLSLESFADKPQAEYRGEDLDSLKEVIFRLKDIQERIFDLIEISRKNKEDNGLNTILDRIYDLIEQKRFSVERIANLYEEYLNRV